MKIESERLEMIPFSEELLTDRIMSWFDNEDLMRYYTNSKKKITREELLGSIEAGINSGTAFTYFIKSKETGQIIGTTKVGPINLAHKISDIPVLIGDKTGLGKGIGSEAIVLGNKLAFEHYDIRKLFGGIYASNIASIKAFIRSGWVVEGVLKGHYWNNGKNEDRILVGCFNPKYFTPEEIAAARYEDWYKNNS
ncbi:GNAT family N-acetyltransferase [Penaeicola halotolerans]|uniref:GNAT family N-acetyltransferase n=1 Tax=Penaeicola halotolerans TaxID=2793196 RepID=UPI001CF81151|nr:GNAT family protein [Penaeicola halotolerans]